MKRLALLVPFVLAAGCGVETVQPTPTVPASSPRDAAIVGVLDDPATDAAMLEQQAGLAALPAQSLVAHRDGADGLAGTADDAPYATLADVAAVPSVDAAAIDALAAFVDGQGYSAWAQAAGSWEGVAFDGSQVAIALDLAAHADETTLDVDAGLDSRAAHGIVTARPATMEALAAVPYVGHTAMAKIFAFLPTWQAQGMVVAVYDGIGFTQPQVAGALAAANQADAATLASAGIKGTPATVILSGRPWASLAAVSGASGIGPVTMTHLKALASSMAPDALGAQIAAAAAGLDMMSESDARAVLIESTATGSGAITPAEILADFTTLHDAEMRDTTVWFFANPGYVGLAARTPEIRDAGAFFASFEANADPNDPASLASAQKWTALGNLLGSKLTNLTVIRFDEQAPPSSAITASVFIVGRDASGRVVGVLTGVVET